MRPWAHVHLKVGSAWEESNHLGNPHSVITVAFCLNLTAGFQIASTFSLEEGEGFCILLFSTSFFPLVLFRVFFYSFSASLNLPPIPFLPVDPSQCTWHGNNQTGGGGNPIRAPSQQLHFLPLTLSPSYSSSSSASAISIIISISISIHPSPSSRSTHLISFLIFLFINLRFQTSSSSPPVSPSSRWQEWRLHTGFQTNNPSKHNASWIAVSTVSFTTHTSQRQFSFSPKKVKGLAAAFNSQVTQTWPFLVVLRFIAHNRVHIPSHVFIQAGAKGPCLASSITWYLLIKTSGVFALWTYWIQDPLAHLPLVISLLAQAVLILRKWH